MGRLGSWVGKPTAGVRLIINNINRTRAVGWLSFDSRFSGAHSTPTPPHPAVRAGQLIHVNPQPTHLCRGRAATNCTPAVGWLRFNSRV